LSIVFADKSSIFQNLNPRGTWKRKGESVEYELYAAQESPYSAMAWGETI
jgi:hypothetical protein